MDSFLELHLDKRIAEAKARAENIISNKHSSFEDSMFYLRAKLSRHYNIPIFNEYFEKRTIDELIFEIELINALNTPTESRSHSLLSDNKEEAKGLFDDWADAEMDETPENQEALDQEFSDFAKQFMENGDFK